MKQIILFSLLFYIGLCLNAISIDAISVCTNDNYSFFNNVTSFNTVSKDTQNINLSMSGTSFIINAKASFMIKFKISDKDYKTIKVKGSNSGFLVNGEHCQDADKVKEKINSLIEDWMKINPWSDSFSSSNCGHYDFLCMGSLSIFE